LSNQGDRQASVRAVTGTEYPYEGDWHALFDMAGIPVGTYNERLLAWINDYLTETYTNINDAMAAFAIDQGVTSWNELGTFDAGGGSGFTTLDFSSTLPPEVTFTRASTVATFINSSGFIETATTDVPRFTHNPVTLTAIGLMIEGARTNILTYSNDFSNAAWTKFNTTSTSASATSPDGTNNGWLMTANTNNAEHYNVESFSATSGSHVFSCFVKAQNYNYVQLAFNSGPGGAFARFNLTTGLVDFSNTFGSGFSAVVASIIPHGDDWYRVSLKASVPTATIQCRIHVVNNAPATTFVGNNTDGVFIYGAQVEVAIIPSSYIPTSASTVTRAIDVCTGTLGGYYNATEGTILVTGTVPYLGGSGTARFVTVDDGTANEAMSMSVLDSASDAFNGTITDGGVDQMVSTAGTYTANAQSNMALAYKLNDSQFAYDGSPVATDTSCTIPTVTTLHIGNRAAADMPMFGSVKTVTIYQTRLPQ
jgi:hypothetical protein